MLRTENPKSGNEGMLQSLQGPPPDFYLWSKSFGVACLLQDVNKALGKVRWGAFTEQPGVCEGDFQGAACAAFWENVAQTLRLNGAHSIVL